MSYHVFIDRAQDPSNVAQVAAAIAKRYGLPADAISQRMTAGRFRVKADVDLNTAKTFAADLQKLGAIAAVVDASTGKTLQERATAPTIAQPAGIPSGGHRARAVAAGAQKPLAPTPPAAGTSPKRPNPEDLASGLSAAYSGSHEVQSLGAIESGEFNLSSLDGADDPADSTADPDPTPTPPPDPGTFAPPDGEEEALVLLDTEEPKPAAPAAAAGGGADAAAPVDEFAPPSQDSIVDIADIAVEATPPPPPMPTQQEPSGLSEAQRFSQELAARQGTADPSAAEQTGGTKKQPVDLREQFREMFVERPRVRFGVGVVLMIMLAWIPANIFWGSKVASAQAELNVTLQETVTLAKSDEAVWTDFEDIARKERELAGSRLFNKRITAVMIWLGLGGIVGFVYFRKIPWDDI